jgi:hypothetical protein
MPTNSHFQKIISILLILILMAELPGCVTSVKFIQSSDLPLKEPHPVDKYHSSIYTYVICTKRTDNPKKNKAYVVKKISISNGYLTADKVTPLGTIWNTVSIFVASDSLIKVASDQSVKIALEDIYNVRVQETDQLLFWGYTLVAVISFYFIIDFIFGPFQSSGNMI